MRFQLCFIKSQTLHSSQSTFQTFGKKFNLTPNIASSPLTCPRNVRAKFPISFIISFDILFSEPKLHGWVRSPACHTSALTITNPTGVSKRSLYAISLFNVKSLQKKKKISRRDAKSQRNRKENFKCFSFALSLRLCAFACAFVFGFGLSELG